MQAYKTSLDIKLVLVHTSQHYDDKMCDLFFRHLDIPEPVSIWKSALQLTPSKPQRL